MLDVRQTASYEITLIWFSVAPLVCLHAQLSLLFSDIVQVDSDSWP